jgi:chemotaxis protein methyltransferase CheR
MSNAEDIEIRLLLEAIYLRYHYDFRSYSLASVKRRLTAARSDFGLASTTELQEKVLRDSAAFPKLLQFLTIQTSEMFRDPGFFRAMRERIVPVLATYASLKIWVAGCSAGEELYSVAIVLREAGLLDRSILYATDINPEALRKAEAGVYSAERLATFEENYRQSGGEKSLSDYYSAAYRSIAFDRSLRKNVVFSDHSLATDSVFAEVQLVSCRNVLIYFNRELQERAVGLLADSLCHRGFLGLGAKETLRFTPYAQSFEELVPEERWYRRC